jgi:hypothetical protein
MKICTTLTAALAAALCLPAQTPDFKPPTPLFAATLRNDTAEVKRLLASGANPNEGRFVGATPIFFALIHRNREMVEAMIEKGADVKARDRSGSTTLMWAAADERGETGLLSELLKLGVDPNTRNNSGETALSLALRRGRTPAVELLEKAGASEAAQIRQSVDKAIALLQKSGPEFVKVSGCASCHHQSLPQMAYATARERGFTVNAEVSQQQTKVVLAMYKPMRERMAQGEPVLPDPGVTVSYALLGLAAEGYEPDAVTEAMAYLVSTQQTPDGDFRVLPGRPPMESSSFASTALSIRALQVYGKQPEQQVLRARKWLTSAKPVTMEDRAMQLLGLVWTKADAKHVRSAARDLLAEQRPDGGWAQLPALETDAYATGQALVALHTAGQLTASDPAYQRATNFLLRTQHDDGSWFVRSRSIPFQPYKESGFPHGRHQWISASGTSWAAMALSLTQPAAQQISRVF